MSDWCPDGLCPKCAKALVRTAARSEPHCTQHGLVVDKIYRCHCGKTEEFRAIDDIPQYCHYCARCAEALLADVREHLAPVVAQSTMTTGS